MNGSQLTKQDILKATKQIPADGDYVWDGVDEDERPLTKDEMRQAISRGNQKAPTKKAITIRLTPSTLEYFRATGKGWQTRIDEALAEYIKMHH